MPRWTLRQKLFSGNALTLLLGVLVVLVALSALRSAVDRQALSLLDEVERLERTEHARALALLKVSESRGYWLTADQAYLDRVQQARSAFLEVMAKLKAQPQLEPGERRLLEAIGEAESGHQRALTEALAQAPAEANGDLGATFERTVAGEGRRVAEAFGSLLDYQRARLERERERAEGASRWTIPIVLASSLGGLLLVWGLARLNARALARDEASRRQLEGTLEALSRSEARFRRLAQSNMVGVFFWNTDGRILDANDAFLDQVGRSRTDLEAGRLRWNELVSPAQESKDQAALRELQQTGVFRPFERNYVRADGEVVTGLTGGTFLEGSTTEGVSFTLDTTQLRRAEESVRTLAQVGTVLVSSLESKKTLPQVLRLALPLLGDWGWVDLVDEEQHLDTAALACADTQCERALLQARDAAHQQAEPRAVLRAIADRQVGVYRGGAQVDREVFGQRPSPALETQTVMVLPLMVRRRVVGVMVLGARSPHAFGPEQQRLAEELARRCANALDNSRLYQEAQRAIRLRDEFLAVASHELKTPLTPLQLHLQALRRTTGDGEAIHALHKRVEAAERQAKRLGRLVNELLDISRIQTGWMELHRERVDLRALVEEVVQRLREEGTAVPIQVHVAGPVWGRWDPLRLEQVVVNLISNAVKYGEGKPVDITVEGNAEVAHLQVQDHGMGISLESQERIFHRFERAVSARHYGGLGLGLYILRKIVEAHGGSVRVHSTVGEGSLFQVELPVGLSEGERAGAMH